MRILLLGDIKASLTGSFTVTINPVEVRALARWKITKSGYDSGWKTSGFIINDLETGTYTLQFNTVDNWNSPGSRQVTIEIGENTDSASYIRQVGSLTVTITPPSVIGEAQWRVDGGTWRNSGYLQSGLIVGLHTVEFSPVTGWNTPTNQSVQISNGLTTTTGGTYVQQIGSLQVTISPQGAIDAGARWRVDGGTWRNSGYLQSGLIVGSYTVDYLEISCWNVPLSHTVQINANKTTSTSRQYATRANIYSDNRVNLIDFSIMANRWQDTPCIESDWCEQADIDKSGVVDMADLRVLCEKWLADVGP